jgi:AraC family transcriptional regulator of adaptative response / DNA-3-methyladenine glycosylase II
VDLDRRTCYRALETRDRRFDGRFFTGVLTTGIYCRPICPARTPGRRNVRFYACAAAAEADGFRPCRRCRPETAPGTPAWAGGTTVVQRALRLIQSGAVDENGLDGLAARVGLGERQLRRLFEQHLGATPAAVARARRVHFALSLVEQTDLRLADVAFASGFGSLRQFNDTIKATCGRPPSALRQRPSAIERGAARPIALRLAYRPPFDWTRLLAFLGARAIPGVEQVRDGVWSRTIRAGSAAGWVSVSHEAGASALRVEVWLPSAEPLMGAVARVRRVFDLDADPLRIHRYLKAHPLLGAAVARSPGLRVPGAWDPFELSVRAIVGQQVSVKGATTLAGRIAARCGVPVTPAVPGLTRLFPDAPTLAGADLSGLGLTNRRIATIQTLATAVADGAIRFDAPRSADEIAAALSHLPGIGDWTAQYIAMRALGDPDALPAGDLALRRAAGGLSPRALTETAEAWRPWRSYAAMYLWSL